MPNSSPRLGLHHNVCDLSLMSDAQMESGDLCP
jgi:hypothetical protein